MGVFDSIDNDYFTFDVEFSDRPDIVIKALYRCEALNTGLGYDEKIQMIDADAYLKGQNDDIPVGDISFEIRPSRFAYISGLYVDKRFEHCGIDSALLAFMENLVKEKNSSMIGSVYEALTKHDKQAYRKSGYRFYKQSKGSICVSKDLKNKELSDNIIYSNFEILQPTKMKVDEQVAEQDQFAQ